MAATAAKLFRAACVIACAGAFGCTPTQEATAPPPQAIAQASAQKREAEPMKPAEVLGAKAAPKVAKKSKPMRKVARKPEPPPPPKPVEPTPPPPPDPAIERARRLDEYIAGLRKTVLTFNPPSPMEVERRSVVPLAAEPPKEAAQLAEELRKIIPGAEAWRPRLRAQLAAADFDIAPLEKDSVGAKELSPIGRTEWSWGVVPKLPGNKQLTVRVAIVLPPGMGEPRELPVLQRAVTVESTPTWLAGKLWSDYWAWIIGALALGVAALAWWRR